MCNTQKLFVIEPTQRGWRTSKLYRKKYSNLFYYFFHHATPQVIRSPVYNRRSRGSKPGVQYMIYGDQTYTGRNLITKTSVFPCQCHSFRHPTFLFHLQSPGAKVTHFLTCDSMYKSWYPAMYFPYWRWAVYKGRKSAILVNISYIFLISNFRRVLNVVCFVPGNSPASEFLYK
jgi:hypothetical protein